MSESKEQLLNEARVFFHYAPHILPMIEKRKNLTIEELYVAQREGNNDYVALVAKLSVYMELEKEIINKARAYENVEERLNGKSRK